MDSVHPHSWTISGIMSQLHQPIRHNGNNLPKSPVIRANEMGAIRIRSKSLLIPQRGRIKSLQTARIRISVASIKASLRLQHPSTRAIHPAAQCPSINPQHQHQHNHNHNHQHHIHIKPPRPPPTTSGFRSRTPFPTQQPPQSHLLLFRNRTPHLKLHRNNGPTRRRRILIIRNPSTPKTIQQQKPNP